MAKRWALLIVSAAVVVLIRLVLTLASHRAVLLFLPQRRSSIAHRALVARTCRSVASVARWVPAASCLTQALSVQLILAWRGYRSDVRIGVRQTVDGTFEAHAWLTSGGEIAIGGTPESLSSFALLTNIDSG